MKSLLSFFLEITRKGLILFIKTFILPRQSAGVSSAGEHAPRRHSSVHATVASFPPLYRKLFYTFAAIGGGCVIVFLFVLNGYFLVEVPAYGGTLVEGVVGTPRFINPLLAISDTDRDLTQLVYSGLMRATPDGTLVPDLAEEYSVSADGLVYTFVLREETVWHDGAPLTADDVLFTIGKAQDPLLKSQKRANWEGVTAKKIDEHTVTLTLAQPYAPFLENAAGLGILPEHLWGRVTAEQFGFAKFNESPIGSGPYRIDSVHKDGAGIPLYYDLTPFKRFSLGSPYISKVRIRFYANEEGLLTALNGREIGAVNALAPKNALAFKEMPAFAIKTYRLPRAFGVFLNQNQNSVFAQKSVREALARAVDRDSIVASVLHGFGTALYGPLPPGSLGFTAEPESAAVKTAQEILQGAGWTLSEETGIFQKKTKTGTEKLSFSLSVPDTEELRAAAELVKKQWEAMGAAVTLRVFEPGDLHQNIIRPRKYDALFFGEIIGRESDPFAFWHSSQRNDPGLNIALYANITVDTLLTRGRTTLENEERAKIYGQFEDEIAKDIPAVFVYSPDFLYILPAHVRGISAGTVTVPSERFLDINTWFINTDNVWRIFK